MTPGQLIALLQNAAVDAFGQLIFRDQAGNLCTPQITVYGPVAHLNPTQPTDPSYVEIKLVTSTS